MRILGPHSDPPTPKSRFWVIFRDFSKFNIDLVNTCWLSVDQNYFFEKYASRAFKCRVDDNFSMSGYENSTWWSYNIFGHFRCIFGIFHQITKMTKNVRKCCNFIRLDILDQKSKNYHRHVIWKPWIHTFQKNNFGQHLVNRCWLKFHPKPLYIVLGVLPIRFSKYGRSTPVDWM